MPSKILDHKLIVELSAKHGMKAQEIADTVGCRRGAVYRAFRMHGHFVGQMKECRLADAAEKEILSRIPRGPRPGQNPATINPRRLAEQERVASLPRVDRDVCPRCGIRGDIGCRHNRRSRLGWSVG